MHKFSDHINAVNHLSLVEPHAVKLEQLAADLDAAGIGGDVTQGHAVVLRRMAAQLRSEAAQGRISSAFHAGAEPAKLNATTTAILKALC
jgi:hypothetical protein